MCIEQRLARCEVCAKPLVIEYKWSGPSLKNARIRILFFSCPNCAHSNPLFVPWAVLSFVVKLVPGVVSPQGVRPNTVRRFWMSLAIGSPSAPGAPPKRSTFASRALGDTCRWLALVQNHWQYICWWMGALA